MFTKTIGAAVLAASLAAGLAPAFALTSAAPEVTAPAPIVHGNYSASGLPPAALAQVAASAGVSLEQARGMTLSQLYFLKEGRDSDTPDVWKGQQPLPWPSAL
ncbi:MAG: hypothetical protein U1E59_09820 [Amaricoccus sp.]